jgi:GntR family transcriptional regulator
MAMLNPESPVPLYHQLADILMARIRTGEYEPGTRIPSENKLAAGYGIGRPTVRQAIDMLVRKRILLRKRGSGTYVCKQEKEIDLFSLAGTMSSFHRKGISVQSRIKRQIKHMRVAPDDDNPFSERNAFFLARVSTVEKEPVLLEEIYLHPELFTGIEEIRIEGRSLSQLVEKHYFMTPTGGRQNFRIAYLTGERARYLKVAKDKPVLEVQRYIHFQQADNAVYARMYCRTERFVFSQALGGVHNG